MTAAPEIWTARTIPTSPRILVVHGQDLWRGTPADLRRLPTLSLAGETLRYYPDAAAEPNYATPRVLQFIVPDAAPEGDAEVVLTRNDGATTAAIATIGQRASLVRDGRAGETIVVDETIIVDGGKDFEGATLRVAGDFAARSVVELRRGFLRNCTILVDRRVERRFPQWGVYVRSPNAVGLANVRIRHMGEGGAGLYLHQCSRSCFTSPMSSETRIPCPKRPSKSRSKSSAWRNVRRCRRRRWWVSQS